MNRLLCSGLVVTCVIGLASCSGRSDSDAAEQFVTAFNDGSLADHTDLFKPSPSSKQLDTLTKVGQRCSIDPDSVVIVDTVVSSHRRTVGAIANCGGRDFSLITGVNRDCESDPECDDDFQIDPGSLPGGEAPGRTKNDSLPQRIRTLEPLEPTPK